MSESSRISARDYRRAIDLVYSIVEVGHDPKLWIDRMLVGLCGLLRGCAATAGMARLPVPGQMPGNLADSVDALYVHGLSPEHAKRWTDFSLDPANAEAMRTFNRMAARPVRFITVRRQDVFTNAEWYAEPIVHHVFKPIGLDANMMSNVMTFSIKRVFGMGIHRAWGDDQFSVADRRLMRFFHAQLARAYRSRLAGPTPSSLVALSSRQLQVVFKLCEGLAEKEVATALGISQHTVHNHVKAIYLALNVTSRGELLRVAFTQPVGARSVTLPEPNIVSRSQRRLEMDRSRDRLASGDLS
jgi:DNA-binding CsgD family transcriptional regulator